MEHSIPQIMKSEPLKLEITKSRRRTIIENGMTDQGTKRGKCTASHKNVATERKIITN